MSCIRSVRIVIGFSVSSVRFRGIPGLHVWSLRRWGKNERSDDDLKLVKLAREKHWQRCAKCRFFVEKRDGCPLMRCRFDFGLIVALFHFSSVFGLASLLFIY